MSLSKKEQIAVYIVIFMVIAAVGTFVFLLPEYNKIGPNRDTLARKQSELAGLQTELGIDKFEMIENEIIKAYEDGKHVSENFYEIEFQSYEADRLVRGVLAEMNLSTDNLDISGLTTHAMSLNLFRPSVISYNIKDVATIGTAQVGGDENNATDGTPVQPVTSSPVTNNNMSELARTLSSASRAYALEWFETEMEKIRNGIIETEGMTALDLTEAMREFLVNETETVVVQNVRFEIPLTASEATHFSMHMYNLDKATYIFSMTSQEMQGEATTGGEVEGLPAITAGGKRLYTVEVMFLIVEPMNEPNFEYRTRFAWE